MRTLLSWETERFVEFPYEVEALLNERRLVPLLHEPVEDPSE